MHNRLSLINWLKSINSNKLFQVTLISIIISSGIWEIRGLNLKILDIEQWDLKIFDYFFALKPQDKPDNRIVIIGVEEEDIREFGYPIPDGTLAQLLLKVTENKIEKRKEKEDELHFSPIIGLDIIRDIPVPPGHKQLREVFQTTPNLIGVGSTLTKGEQTLEFPPVLLEKNQVGDIAVPVDRDLIIRKGFLWPNLKNHPEIPSLSLKLALMYLSNQGIKPKHSEINNKWMQLKETSFPIFRPTDGGYVSDEGGGYQILINWRKNGKPFPKYSLLDVLNDENNKIDFTNKIVLIAGTAPSINDTFITPLSLTDKKLPKKTYGVSNIAHLTSQIISSVLDERPLIKSIPDWVELLELWLWTLGISFILIKVNSDPFQYLINILLVIGGSSVIVFSIHYILFLNGYWIPLAPIFLSTVLTGIFYLLLSLYKNKKTDLTGMLCLLLSVREYQKINSIITKFNSILTNQLANPIFQIRETFSNLTLSQELSSQESKQMLDYMTNLVILKESGEKVINIVQNTFPSFEDGTPINCTNFNNWIEKIVFKIIDEMRSNFGCLEIAQIEFRKEYDSKLFQKCVINSQLEFIIRSILKNAVESVFYKYEEELNYQPKITIKSILVNFQQINVIIQDNGFGIPSKHENLVFKPFFTTKNQEQHSGLSLYYCEEII
ncbi:CHASE2 domain-containing protein, partial [Crocosphaera chwakensis]